jgi:type IV pilus assembly protein PilM
MIVEDVVWGLDIGRSSLKAIRMHRLRDTAEITGVDIVDYYGSSEEQPSSAEIRQALAQFKQRNKVKSTDIIAVAVPGYAAFTRFIKLPPVEDKKIADVVKYEAAQQIPFPLNDVVWGFQKVERNYQPGEEIDVGIFAIREEIVKNFLADFDAAKLQVDILTIAPLALFNFAHHEMDIPDEAVVVDIGADHTDLVVIDGGKFHVRNLPLAGNDITKKLREEFDISFAEAEKLKIKAAQSKQADKLFAVMQPVLRDFVSEIMRSLSFYKSKASQMILLGNATKLEGLARFFSDNLDMKISRFFDIMHVELAHDVDINLLQEHLPSFGVAMGLALQGIAKGPSKVNLVPQKLYKQRMLERKQPMFVVAAALLFLLILFMYISGSRQQKTAEEALDRVTSILDDYDKIEQDYEEIKKLPDIRSRALEIVDFMRRRNLPIGILNKINLAVPDNLSEIPDALKGRYARDLFGERINSEMDIVNRDKVWLLELEMKEVTDPPEQAGMEVVLTAAVVADEGDLQTDQRLKQIFADKLAKQFGVDTVAILELPVDKRISTLSPNKTVSLRPDNSRQDYYKFNLRWKVPFPKAESKTQKESTGKSGAR